MIEVQEVSKRYGTTLAVDQLSFVVPAGRVTGFLGPNGAGKSTTMRMIVGLDKPSSGQVLVHGAAYRDLRFPLHQVGALLEARAIHPGRSARNHLRWLADSNGIPRRRVDEVLELVGLTAVARRRSGGFSLGMGQRLGIAAALLGDPGVVLLDEPVNGLDPEGIIWVRQLLRSLAAEGRTVLVSSHLMSEMALTADHLIVIGQGRLIVQGSVDEVIHRSSTRHVRVVSPAAETLAGLLRQRGAEVEADGEDGLFVAGMECRDVGTVAGEAGLTLYELSPQEASLEEAFLELTRDATDYQTEVRPVGSANMSAAGATTLASPAARRVTWLQIFVNAGRAEWTKIRSVRSTMWSLLVTVAIVIGLGALFCAARVSRWDSINAASQADFDPTQFSLNGLFLAQLAVGVLGVLVMSSEYATGQIRATLEAVPQRTTMLAAKVVVFAVVVLVVGLVACFGAFLIGQQIFSSKHAQATLGQPHVLRAVIGGALYLVVIGCLGIGLAAILRRTAGAIAALVSLLLILPILVSFLPSPWSDDIAKFLPGQAGAAIFQVVPGTADNLSTWTGFAVFCLYAVVALAGGAYLLNRRDA